MYCGRELSISAEQAQLFRHRSRKLEPWEKGFNVIIWDNSDGDLPVIELSDLLGIEPADAETILKAGCPLPTARIEFAREAYLLADKIRQVGLKTAIVSDADLDAEHPPIRSRGLDLHDGEIALKDFNTTSTHQIRTDDIGAIVHGTILASRTDIIEKKRRRGKTKLLDESETTFDEIIIDIYSKHDPRGFRIYSTGFDFTCLGADKGLLAGENMRLLIGRLSEMAPSSAVISNYDNIKEALGMVWEVESRKDSKGLQRAGFGKVEFGSVASTSNLRQFTKFSRLQWHLL